MTLNQKQRCCGDRELCSLGGSLARARCGDCLLWSFTGLMGWHESFLSHWYTLHFFGGTVVVHLVVEDGIGLWLG
jgi:hypothetical protein